MVDLPENNDYLADKNSNSFAGESDEYVSGADYRSELAALQPRVRPKAGWQQKFAIVFLSLFGISAIILWAVQFNSGLQVSAPLTAEELAELERSRPTEAEVLRGKDTDGDGLDDYSELYVYQTSPYLEDTDSDGISDSQEIASDSDPNCPLGQECGVTDDVTATSPAPTSDTTADSLSSADEVVTPASGSNVNVDQQALADILSGEVDAPTLRVLLQNSGMSGDLLSSISDEQLLTMYRQMLESQQ